MMNSSYKISKAVLAQAEQICHVLIRSIQEICTPDHHNDPEILSDWLQNKTVDHVKQWVQSENNYSVVALAEDKVIGISMMSKKGEILLNYLLPEFLHKGIGKQMLIKLENFANEQNMTQISVSSTITAKPFYVNNGFTPLEASKTEEGLLIKVLK